MKTGLRKSNYCSIKAKDHAKISVAEIPKLIKINAVLQAYNTFEFIQMATLAVL